MIQRAQDFTIAHISVRDITYTVVDTLTATTMQHADYITRIYLQ